MTTEHTASVRVEDGNLTVTRPHPAPGPVDDLIDDLVYRIRDTDTPIVGVEVTVEVTDAPQTTDEPAPDPQTDPTTPRQPGTPPPAGDDTPTLSASATGSLNPPVPPADPDPLAPSGA